MTKSRIIILGLSLVVIVIFWRVIAVTREHSVTPPAPIVTPASASYHPATEVYFSPHGGCTDAVVRTLDAAKSSVYLQAYSFTSKPIANAIVRDAMRGLTVKAILDHSQESERSSRLDDLLAAHIPVLIDHVHAIAHSKIMIIDGQEVITGSFNFTNAAENENAENLLILYDRALASRYQQNWDEQSKICDPATQ